MSLLTGVLSLDGSDIDPAWLENMRSVYASYPCDGRDFVHFDTAAFGREQRYSVPEAPNALPVVSDKQLTMVFDGRIDNRDELAQALDILIGPQIPDEDLVLASYVKWGHEAPKYLIGDFAFGIFDANLGQLFLVRDHLGTRPLYIARTDRYFAFASSALPLLQLPWVDQTCDQQWVADYLTITKVDRTASFVKGISKFPPRSTLCLPHEQSPKPYWDLNIQSKPLNIDSQTAVERFTELFDQSVKCRSRCFGELSSELSGGLDSTSISVTAAQQMQLSGQTLNCYSHVLPIENRLSGLDIQDERPQIKAVLEQAPPIVHHLFTGGDEQFFPNLDASLETHGGPSGHDLNQFAPELLRKLKAQKRRVLLSGFGGDQLVTSQAKIRSADIGRDTSLFDWWSFKRNDPIAFLKGIAIFGMRRIRGEEWYVRRQQSIHEQSSARYLGLNKAFIARHGFPMRYGKHLSGSLGFGRRNRMRETVLSPAVQFRLEESAVGAAAFGVDYRYPMLDIRLLEFCLNLPHEHTICRNRSRLMIRKAMRGRLADEVRVRNDKNGATIGSVARNFVKDVETIAQYFATNFHGALALKTLNLKQLPDLIRDIPEQSTFRNQMKIPSALRALAIARWSEFHEKK